MTDRKYFLFNIVLAAIVLFFAWLISLAMPEGKFPWMALGLATAAVLSVVAFILTAWSLEKKPGMFLSFFMMGMMAKMGGGILGIVIVAMNFKPQMLAFAVAFLVGYFVFTLPEVIFLRNKAMQSDPKKDNDAAAPE